MVQTLRSRPGAYQAHIPDVDIEMATPGLPLTYFPIYMEKAGIEPSAWWVLCSHPESNRKRWA